MHKDTILPHQDWLGSKDQKWFRVQVTAGRKFTNQNLYSICIGTRGKAGQGSLYNNVIDNILFSLPKVVNVGLEALGHEIVCDLLVVALVNVRC